MLPAGLVEHVDTAGSLGLADTADNDVPDTVDYADTVAQSRLVAVADTGIAVFDTVDFADTAEVADTVGLVHTVDYVDNAADLAAGTADIVGATEWQPYSTVVTLNPCFSRLQKGKNRFRSKL